MKQLMAILMMIALSLGMTEVRYGGEACTHEAGFELTEHAAAYAQVDAFKHAKVVVTGQKCVTCGAEKELSRETVEEAHQNCEWQDEHLDEAGMHRYEYVCRDCDMVLEWHEIRCSGNPHATNIRH